VDMAKVQQHFNVARLDLISDSLFIYHSVSVPLSVCRCWHYPAPVFRPNDGKRHLHNNNKM